MRTTTTKRKQTEMSQPVVPAERASVAERKEALMAVALELFARRSFSEVTIKDIAGELGINTALLYYYFQNKEDLLRATIEDTVERAFEHFQGLRDLNDGPAEVISDWLHSHVDLSKPIQYLVKVALDYRSSNLKSPAIDRAIRRFYTGEERILSECLAEGIALGLFRSTQPLQVAQFISVHLDGLMVRSVIQPRFDLTAAVAQLREMLWSQLGYLSKAAEPSQNRVLAKRKPTTRSKVVKRR